MRRSTHADRDRGTHPRDARVARRIANAATTRVVGSRARRRRRRRRRSSPNRETRARGRAVAGNFVTRIDGGARAPLGQPPREAYLRVIVKVRRHLSRVERVRPARVNSATSPRTTCGRRVIRRADGAAGFRLRAGRVLAQRFVRSRRVPPDKSPLAGFLNTAKRYAEIERNAGFTTQEISPPITPQIFGFPITTHRGPRFSARLSVAAAQFRTASRDAEGFANFCTLRASRLR